VEASANLIFIIAAFGLAIVLILMRERLPANIRRPMAIISIFLVLFAFFLIVLSFFRAGI
jgi:hypothetical protein